VAALAQARLRQKLSLRPRYAFAGVPRAVCYPVCLMRIGIFGAFATRLADCYPVVNYYFSHVFYNLTTIVCMLIKNIQLKFLNRTGLLK